MNLISNKAECLNCRSIIESKHAHDFVACMCFENSENTSGIYIDGGTEYKKIGGNVYNYLDRSEYEE
jgi:hypothetical protein